MQLREGFSKVIILIGICVIIITFSFLYVLNSLKKMAVNPSFLNNTSPVINKTALSKDSAVIDSSNITYFSLQTENDGYIYKAKAQGLAAVQEFIRVSPRLGTNTLIPANFLQNSLLTRSVKDSQDEYLKQNQPAISNEHYFFNQEIQNIPVFLAQLAVHVRNGNEIYSEDGNLVKNQTIGDQKISEEQAKAIALKKAQEEEQDMPVQIEGEQKYILNKKILGTGTDETNYLTLAVTLRSTGNDQPFGKQYFVDLTSGSIVYENNLVLDALQRNVTDNTGGRSRSEGQAAVGGNGNVDKIYDMLGQYYNYFFQTFQRDSLDGHGMRLNAVLIPPCANASWTGQTMSVCSDMIIPDVITHELTHGITQYTAALNVSGEAGALNEGNSDIFSTVFTKKWNMGNGKGGIVRDLQNPNSTLDPDKLFSANWSCSNDVHRDSTVESHAFYLMHQGGSFNGCTIKAIGDDAYKIQYQALTKYLRATANYKDYYTAMNNACNDLFKQGSVQCTTVLAALVATETDQQTAGIATNPKCSGTAEKAPVCPAYPVQQVVTAPPVNIAPGVPSPVCAGSTSNVCTPSVTAAPVISPISINTVSSSVSVVPVVSVMANQPCISGAYQSGVADQYRSRHHHAHQTGSIGQLSGSLIQILMQLIQLLIQLLGGGIQTPSVQMPSASVIPSPAPCIPSVTP